jgi:hypothetical protein
MARGAQAKQEVLKKIKEVFPNLFEYGKEIRIPMEEDGQRVEIKIALTCAKTNVGGDDALVESGDKTEMEVNAPAAEPSAEEKENIAKLMDRLGI